MSLSGLKKIKNVVGIIFSVYQKQLMNFMQILNIINFIDFSLNKTSNQISFTSDILSGSFLRFFSLDCIFACI